jgi:serine/threonine protein kinase
MSQVSLSTAGQPPEDLPPVEEADDTLDLSELASVGQPLTDPEADFPTLDVDAAALANAAEAGAETLVGRELQRGKYRLLALRPTPDDLMQAGVSYVALHTDLQKRLLLRYLPLDIQASATERDETTHQFLREVRALARLGHPSLPRVHDYFCEGDACYVVMDDVAEYTLADVLAEAAREGRSLALPPLEIARLGLELARALAYLHQQQPPIALGGLRPQDVALPEDGPAQLVSLGALSLVASSLLSLPGFASLPTLPLVGEATAPSAPVEEAADLSDTPTEPGHAAPEDEPTLDAVPALGQEEAAPDYAPPPHLASPLDDVYSLGLLLRELAGGPEVIARVMDRQQHPEQVVEDDAPPLSLALAAVIEIAANVDPERRFQNAAALENALARAYAVERRIARLAGNQSIRQTSRLERGQLEEIAAEPEPGPDSRFDLATQHISTVSGGPEQPATICWKCGARNQPGELLCRVCGARQPVLAGRPRATQTGQRRISRPPKPTRQLYDDDEWAEWSEEDEEDYRHRPRRTRPLSGRLEEHLTYAPGAKRRTSRPAPQPDKGQRVLWALVWVCFSMAILLGSATLVVAYLALQ